MSAAARPAGRRDPLLSPLRPEPTWPTWPLVEVDLSFVNQMEAGTVEGSLPVNARKIVCTTDNYPAAFPLCGTRVARIGVLLAIGLRTIVPCC
jgi:hypothetical protein